jgi:hypothetical protein
MRDKSLRLVNSQQTKNTLFFLSGAILIFCTAIAIMYYVMQ